MPTAIAALQPTFVMQDVILHGSALPVDISQAVTDANIQMSTDGVTELTFTYQDPGFRTLAQKYLSKGSPVDYHDLKLIVAAIETAGGNSGLGEITITCRPAVVNALKWRRGPLVMRNVSPSEFVQRECAAVNAPSVVQPSSKQASIARDVYTPGQTDVDSSSWTTFTRLGDEIGYNIFEVAGVIYFGKYQYFMDKNTKVDVHWGVTQQAFNDPLQAATAPECRTSIDNATDDSSVSVTVPMSRAQAFRAGYILRLKGVPGFERSFFITSVSYSLSLQGTVSIDASIPTDPTPNPPDDTSGGSGEGGDYTPDQQMARGEAYLAEKPTPAAQTYVAKPFVNGGKGGHLL